MFIKSIYNMSENEWTIDIETVLENMRQNCIILSGYHKEKYYHYKGHLKYFKLPLIILSSINSIVAVGLSDYMEQSSVSLLTCLLSLLSAIIGSVELYLGVQKNMENELMASRSFQLLAYDIYKTLSLSSEHRPIKGKIYLDDVYNNYIKLVEQANLLRNKKIKDMLAPIPDNLVCRSPTNSITELRSVLSGFLPNPPSNSSNNSISSENCV
jgi:hypothetical protein